MSQPSNGITPEVIRSVMPPYQLNPDLLQATLAALPPPPPDSTTAWRQAHIARLTQEISALMPANAAQARIAAQVLITRELADALTTQAHASNAGIPLLCRLARTAATVMQTAVMLERSLTRHQQKPAPFFGTVLADDIDFPALDATWHANPDRQPQPVPTPEVPPAQRPPAPPNPAPNQPAPPSPDLAPPQPVQPQPQPDRPSHPPAPTAPDATTPEWSITKLDSRPGWSREVLRHRSSREGGNGSAPGSIP
jgi:hypothetical protein